MNGIVYDRTMNCFNRTIHSNILFKSHLIHFFPSMKKLIVTGGAIFLTGQTSRQVFYSNINGATQY